MSWGIAEMILKGWFDSGAFTCVLLASLLLASPSSAQDGATVHEGLEISIDHLDRGIITPLSDCPPGANIVRGVIAPGTNDTEFVTVYLDFKVLSDFESVNWPRPSIHDVDGRAYLTAQTFQDMGREPEYACNFSFRVPVGMAVKELFIDDITLDLTAHDQ
ncbi:uncharacterized protein METZ01_LOCUS46169 [marine metagenome]|uniref:Uncharacterized protein n=1 Tax=marine metagenome TaxID=408172 RepID=A0A381RN68_9ZZZZ